MPNSFPTLVLMASSVPRESDYPGLYPLVGGSVASPCTGCGGQEHQIRVVLDSAAFS